MHKQTITIQPGDQGVDYAYLTPAARAYILASLKSPRPVKFVARYVASTGKGLDLEEREWLHSLGIGIKAIKERSINDSDGGAPLGVIVAGEAVKQLGTQPAWKGYPQGLAVTMCADKDIRADSVTTAKAYFEAAGMILHQAGYALGMYGDEDCIKAVPSADVTCLPGAWGWSPQWYRAFRANLPWTVTPSMLQKLDKVNQVDVLTVYRPFDVWLPHDEPDPPARPTLRKGSRSNDVRVAQVALTKHGFPCVVDGVFGSQTDRQTRRFQRARGLWVDGVIGPKTWAMLEPNGVQA